MSCRAGSVSASAWRGRWRPIRRCAGGGGGGAAAPRPRVPRREEPFGALDPLTRAELHAEFRRIQDRLRKTVIIVTHDMGEAFALGDRVGVLDEGQLVACDRPETVARSKDPRVRKLLDAVPVLPRQ